MVPRSQVPHVCWRCPGFIYLLEGTMEHTCPLDSP